MEVSSLIFQLQPRTRKSKNVVRKFYKPGTLSNIEYYTSCWRSENQGFRDQGKSISKFKQASQVNTKIKLPLTFSSIQMPNILEHVLTGQFIFLKLSV